MPAMRHLAILLVLPACLLAGEAAPPKDPTAEEVLLLDMFNQHREDPAHNEERVVTAIRNKQVNAEGRAWSHSAPTSGTRPPAVFNPHLVEAARSLLKAGTRPVDLTRFDAAPALNAAGYPAGKESLAMFAQDCPSLALAYVAALTTTIGSWAVNATMTYPKYAGQLALKDDWREAGVAVSIAKGRYSVVMILSPGTAKHHLGGIVFTDANRDGRCQLGEGKAGVKVVCGAASMTTSAGGAWWLAVDTLDKAEVIFSNDSYTAIRPVAKAAPVMTLDWRLPNAADLKTADRLIADAEKDLKNPDADRRKVPLAALLVGTRMAALDDARQKKVDTLVEPIKEEFASTMKRMLAALGEEPAEFKKRLGELQKPWKGAMPAWFKEADALSRLRQQVNAVLASPADQQGRAAQPLLKQLAKAMADTCDPVFFDQYRTWASSLEAALPAEGAPGKKK